MPTFNVQSKIINGNRSAAILKSKDTIIRIRNSTQLSVPVSDGVWVLMHVKNISKEMIELYFPELERTVYLYDSPPPICPIHDTGIVLASVDLEKP